MEPLFPKWSNTLLRTGLVAVAGGALGTILLLMAWVRAPFVQGQTDPVDQPVEFDHRHHVADAGIDCRYCHYPVEQSATAGIPATSLCLNCHGQVWNDAAPIEPIRVSNDTGKPIPWSRVHDLPDFVFFNHAAHVNAGVGCVSCHGRVDQMARVYQVEPLTMQWCLDCHRSPEPFLRPLEYVTDMTWQSSDPDLGRRLAEKMEIQPPTNCSGCHR